MTSSRTFKQQLLELLRSDPEVHAQVAGMAARSIAVAIAVRGATCQQLKMVKAAVGRPVAATDTREGSAPVVLTTGVYSTSDGSLLHVVGRAAVRGSRTEYRKLRRDELRQARSRLRGG